MLLKNLFTTSVLLFAFSLTYAQTKHKLDIKEATVFLKGAELLSKAKVPLKAGENEIVFTNVAANINIKSLNVGTDNNAVVQSALFKKDYLEEDTPSDIIKGIEDSIKTLSDRHNMLQNKANVINDKLKLIAQNRQITGKDTKLTVEDLEKMLDLYDAKLQKLYDAKNNLAYQVNDLRKQIEKLRQQKNEEQNKKVEESGLIVVKFYTKRAINTNVTIKYVVAEAGWIPSYDVRVAKVNAPVQLAYKGQVFQSCGVDWNKVKITLSAGNPSEGVQAPTLNPWRLTYNKPKPVTYYERTTTTKTAQVLDKMPTRNTTNVTSTHPGAYSNDDGRGVSLGGARTDGTLYIVDGVQVFGSRGINMSQGAISGVSTSGLSAKYGNAEPIKYGAVGNIGKYVAIENQGVNTLFDIDLPYTIPSDGKEIIVAIKTAMLPAKYRYYAVPKLDRDVFLQAQITNWEDLNLLPAQTNIFYEGTFIGQGYIDTRNIKDTMSLSLGRDKKLLVQRERDKTLKTVRNIGSNTKELFVYKISIRNTRKEEVELVLLDQVPISSFKSLVVDDIEYGDATFTETNGLLTWKIQLKPSETIEKHMKYTIKYPKYKRITL